MLLCCCIYSLLNKLRNMFYLTLCTLLTPEPYIKCLNNYTQRQNKLVCFTFRVYFSSHRHMGTVQKNSLSPYRDAFIFDTLMICATVWLMSQSLSAGYHEKLSLPHEYFMMYLMKHPEVNQIICFPVLLYCV